ncbi:hypothetical protein O1L60_47715 [Streptomyces diastatochromogenes]|nr:hypothetical protein [Streptomyces diastatochromogenes]
MMTHLENAAAVKESGMTQPHPRTLLQHLLETTPRLNGTTWPRFQVLWGRMAAEAAQGLGLPKLAHVRVSRSTYIRWLSGAQVAKGDTAVVLEWYFGKSAAELAQPVPRREIVRPSPLDPSTLTAATRALDYTWDTSGTYRANRTPASSGPGTSPVADTSTVRPSACSCTRPRPTAIRSSSRKPTCHTLSPSSDPRAEGRSSPPSEPRAERACTCWTPRTPARSSPPARFLASLLPTSWTI